MSFTAEELADQILKQNKVRGISLALNIRNIIWRYLNSCPWFAHTYPEQHDQVNLADKIEKIIRTRWSKKSAETRRKKKVLKQKLEDKNRQLKLF